jgi:ketosteroid isomerase-like protein
MLQRLVAGGGGTGDNLFVAGQPRARAKGSGVDVEMHYFASFRARDGKVTRWIEHLERAEAVEAAGLSG